MDAETYIEARRELRPELARQLRWDGVPDGVWTRVDDLGLVHDAVRHGDKHSWEELQDAAREVREELEKAAREDLPGSTPPGRGDRERTGEIEIDVPDYARARAEIVSALTAELAARHPSVRHRLQLTEQEAKDVLEGKVRANWRENVVEVGGSRFNMKKFRKAARKIVRSYSWRQRDAEWFLLTGKAPQVSPIRLSWRVNPSEREYRPPTAEISVSAPPWMHAKDVARAFQKVQREMNGGDNYEVPARSLELVRFVECEIVKHGRYPWPPMLEDWNRQYPQWRFESRHAFRLHYRRTYERIMCPSYKYPERRDAGRSDPN